MRQSAPGTTYTENAFPLHLKKTSLLSEELIYNDSQANQTEMNLD
jgi:hypothetical protein